MLRATTNLIIDLDRRIDPDEPRVAQAMAAIRQTLAAKIHGGDFVEEAVRRHPANPDPAEPGSVIVHGAGCSLLVTIELRAAVDGDGQPVTEDRLAEPEDDDLVEATTAVAGHLAMAIQRDPDLVEAHAPFKVHAVEVEPKTAVA